MKEKIKFLYYGDSPTANTGFGNVAKNLLANFYATGNYDITVLGIQYFDDPEVDLAKAENLPYRIIPAGNNHSNDMFGRRKLLTLIMNEPFDLILTLQDLQNLDTRRYGCVNSIRSAIETAKSRFNRNTKWVIYTPIDGQMKAWEVTPTKEADHVVYYTHYGMKQATDILLKELEPIAKIDNDAFQVSLNKLKAKSSIIYHGTNTEAFKPLPAEIKRSFRQEYFGGAVRPDDFLIININRNMARKDLPRTIEAYIKVKSSLPNAKLYLHCFETDVGGSLNEIIKAYGNPDGILMPKNISPTHGVSEEVMNKIYNCADVYVTTTLGEGWGLTITEAMATGLPTIIPNHSSLKEIGADGRTLFVESGGYSCTHEDFYRLRPTVDTNDLAKKILFVAKHKNSRAVQEIIIRAYKWSKSLTWQKVSKQWLKLFKEVLR